jgi:hypothetical protein
MELLRSDRLRMLLSTRGQAVADFVGSLYGNRGGRLTPRLAWEGVFATKRYCRQVLILWPDLVAQHLR